MLAFNNHKVSDEPYQYKFSNQPKIQFHLNFNLYKRMNELCLKLTKHNLSIIHFFGLFLSQTHILTFISDKTSLNSLPYFTLLYFLISTFYLLLAFKAYTLKNDRQKGVILQLYEFLILPISSLVCLQIGNSNIGVVYKISYFLMFFIQVVVVGLKIIYLESVTQELAQICGIAKIARIHKIMFSTIIGVIFYKQQIGVIFMAILQMIELLFYFAKFTFRKCRYEYVFFIAIISGMLTHMQVLFWSFFQLEFYFFLGEIFLIFLWSFQDIFIWNCWQLKYTRLITEKSQIPNQQQSLALMMFIKQSLQLDKNDFIISQQSRNLSIIHLRALQLSKDKDEDYNHISNFDFSGKLVDENKLLRMQMKRQIKIQVYQIFFCMFEETNQYCCLEELAQLSIQLGGSYINKAIIMYYQFIQRRKDQSSKLEYAKLNHLYKKIIREVPEEYPGQKFHSFMVFSQQIKILKQKIQKKLDHELYLIQILLEREKRQEGKLIQCLFKRNSQTKDILEIFEACFKSSLYFTSCEFKALMLIFQGILYKNQVFSKEFIRNHFLRVISVSFQEKQYRQIIVVLLGSVHGQILNNNEFFKKQFGLSYNFYSRNAIFELFISDKQKAVHQQNMNNFLELKTQTKINHHLFDCYIMLDRQIGDHKIKSIESFEITVRIYYQIENSINYVCRLRRRQPLKGEQKYRTILKKDYSTLRSNFLEMRKIKDSTLQQLGDVQEICTIEIQNKGFTTDNMLVKDAEKKQNLEFKNLKNEENNYLYEKLEIIQRKLFQNKEKKQDIRWYILLEIFLIILFSIMALILIVNISDQSLVLQRVITDVLRTIGKAQLAQNKILLNLQILTFLQKTTYFPSNICSSKGINNMTAFISNKLLDDITNDTDAFIKTIYLPFDLGEITLSLYQRFYSSAIFLQNYPINTSYHKFIQLLKIFSFKYKQRLSIDPLNTAFFSSQLPYFMMDNKLQKIGSLYSLTTISQNKYIGEVESNISLSESIYITFSIVLIIFISTIRIKDNDKVIDYLSVIYDIHNMMLLDKIKQIKAGLNCIQQAKPTKLKNIEFENQNSLIICRQQKNSIRVPVNDLVNWIKQQQTENNFDQKQAVTFIDEQSSLIDNYHSYHQNQQSTRSIYLRRILFKKNYLIVIIILMIILIVLGRSVFVNQANHLQGLKKCDRASKSLQILQQKFINLIAYVWIRYLSLNTEIAMVPAESMFNEALDSIMQSDYYDHIFEAYPKQIAEKVLNGYVCDLFLNEAQCKSYRNQIFGSGFSVVGPIILKQIVELNRISKSSQDFIYNLCDKTWLFYEGIVPMTMNIAQLGTSERLKETKKDVWSKFMWIGFTCSILLLITVLFSLRTSNRKTIVRSQALSLQRVHKLYNISSYKPMLNQIYDS